METIIQERILRFIFFSDRVVIYSPGHFPKPYKPEIFAYDNLEPIPLNNIISNILYKNGLIEQFSTDLKEFLHYVRNKTLNTNMLILMKDSDLYFIEIPKTV